MCKNDRANRSPNMCIRRCKWIKKADHLKKSQSDLYIETAISRNTFQSDRYSSSNILRFFLYTIYILLYELTNIVSEYIDSDICTFKNITNFKIIKINPLEFTGNVSKLTTAGARQRRRNGNLLHYNTER